MSFRQVVQAAHMQARLIYDHAKLSDEQRAKLIKIMWWCVYRYDMEA